MSAILRSSSRLARLGQGQYRCISSSAVSRKDIVKEIYLNELKAYRPPPQPKDAHTTAVKSFSMPPFPKAPAPPTDLATDLAAYDASDVKIASSAAQRGAAAEVAGGEDVDAHGPKEFLAFLEADLPKRDAHHH